MVKFASLAAVAVFGAFRLFAFDAIADRPRPPRRIFEESADAKAERLKWWTQARFGMFVHFGLYAMPARHEWVKSKERLDATKPGDRPHGEI